MDIDAFGGGLREATLSKRKVSDVDFETMAQADVEALIRRDTEHICSIFGISVRIRLVKFASVTLLINYSIWIGRRCVLALAAHALEQGTSYREIHGQAFCAQHRSRP